MANIKRFRLYGLNEDRAFYLLIVLFLFNQVFSETQFMSINSVNMLLFLVRYAVLGGLMFLFFIRDRKLSITKLLVLGIMMFFIILGLILKDGGLSFLPMTLIILCSKGRSLKNTFRLTIISLIIAHLIVIISAKLGIVEDKVEIRYIGDYKGSVLGGLYERHNMGFMVHNQVALAFFIVYLLYIAYRRESITVIENIVIMFLNYYIFVLFGSRIVFILGIATCVLYYLIKIMIVLRTNKTSRISCPIWFLSFLFCAITSFIVTLSYSEQNALSVMMDTILNNRLHLGKEALDFYGLGFLSFGQNAGSYNSVELLNNTVDNGYIAIYLQMGLVSALLLIGMWTYLAYICEKKKNPFLTLVFVMIAIESLVNSHLGSYKLLPFYCILMNENDVFLNAFLNDGFSYRILSKNEYKHLKQINRMLN